MKQLLAASDRALIAGMNDHAYVAINVDDDHQTRLVRLSPPTDGACKSTKSEPTKVNSQNSENNVNNHQVEAVAITWLDADILFCAVSSHHKFLAIYSISSKDIHAKEVYEMSPILVHKTNKRCCALSFAKISQDGSRKVLDVIVAADLAGDVFAFPIAVDADYPKNVKRLLLGHTASMLTSVKIVDDKIFTADRDEKVRVSSFPQTYDILGYLLGNESYVTDIDVKEGKYCVTVSGDSTMRLWNLHTFQEMASIKLSNIEGDKSEKMNSSPSDSDQQKENVTCIPVRVSFNTEGDLLALIFDNEDKVDVYAIKEKKDTGLLIELSQSIKCEKPLGVAFIKNDLVVLTKEPTYFMSFRNTSNGNFIERRESCKTEVLIREAGKKHEIVMPNSILETDYATGKIKLMRNTKDAKEGFVEHKPWLDGGKVIRKKEKERRRKRRRFEESTRA